MKIKDPSVEASLLLPIIGPQILIPALMVTAENDLVLHPKMSKHMENWVRGQPCSGSWELLEGGHKCPGGCRVQCSVGPFA